MLFHRLPLDESALCSWASDPPSYGIDAITRAPLRMATRILICLDLLAATALVWVLYRHAAPQTFGTGFIQTASCITGSAAIWFLASYATGLYDKAPIVQGRSLLPSAFITCCLAFGPILLAALGSALRTGTSLAFVLICTGCAIFCVATTRIAWNVILRTLLRRGYCIDRVMVLAGTLSAARMLAAELERRTGGRLRTAASVPLPGMQCSPSFSWIEDAIRDHSVDQIVIGECNDSTCVIRGISWQLARLGADVTLIPAQGGPLRLSSAPPDVPPLAEPLPPLSRTQAAGKRMVDVAVALSVLLLTAPALIAISLAIRLDSPGSILFRQKRQGLHGTTFWVWKFRTMYQHMADEGAAIQTCRNDIRVTRLGRFLRRSSLDEMPQLLNVLRGHMSIVGPRPHALGMTVAGQPLEVLMNGYDARHRVKPGITGWAQVNGCRGEVATARELRRRVALDCHYIDNWSYRMDALIMVRTAALLFLDRHAY